MAVGGHRGQHPPVVGDQQQGARGVLERGLQLLDRGQVQAWREELEAAGAWVFTGGLYPPGTATVLRPQPDGGLITTDGPFAEGKEHIGGFTVIRAADLDEALSWGRKWTEIPRLPVEVRPAIGD